MGQYLGLKPGILRVIIAASIYHKSLSIHLMVGGVSIRRLTVEHALHCACLVVIPTVFSLHTPLVSLMLEPDLDPITLEIQCGNVLFLCREENDQQYRISVKFGTHNKYVRASSPVHTERVVVHGAAPTLVSCLAFDIGLLLSTALASSAPHPFVCMRLGPSLFLLVVNIRSSLRGCRWDAANSTL